MDDLGTPTKIDKYTLIPLGVVWFLIIGIIGGLTYLSGVSSTAAAANMKADYLRTEIGEEFAELKASVMRLEENQQKNHIEVTNRLSNIEGRIQR